jgi:hypothetical protein
MKTLLFALAICTSLLPARAQTNTTVPVVGSIPTNLAHLIASADRIVITNRFAASIEKYRGFSLTISGDEARKIVRAISSARHCVPTNSIFDWDLQCYRETHFLADVHLQDSDFVFEGEEYADDSSVLERLYDDLLKRTGAQF